MIIKKGMINMIKGISNEEFNKERTYKDITKEKLIELYINNNFTRKECCKYFNCGNGTLGRRLKKFNIKKGNSLTKIKVKQKLKEKYGYNPYEIIGQIKNDHEKFKVKCKECGTEQKVIFRTLMNKKNKDEYICDFCFPRITKNNYKKLLTKFKGNEYKFIEEYKDKDTPILAEHIECGHKWKVIPYELIKRTSCPKCSKDDVTDKLKLSGKEFVEKLKNKWGYNPYIFDENQYDGYHEKINVKCKECGYETRLTPNNMIGGNKNENIICKKCSNNRERSMEEQELLSFIKNNYNKKIIVNDRSLLNGKEIDIYLPDDNIAFEYNGLYWHSNNFLNKNYHLKKFNKCKDKNIKLIHIYSDEWVFNKENIKEKILLILNKNKTNKLENYKIYKNKSNINIIINNKILITKNYQNYKFNIKKCFKLIFNYFINKQKDYKNIFLYKNLSWNLDFESDNFEKIKITKPNKFYIINGKRYKNKINKNNNIIWDSGGIILKYNNTKE
jgi:hypothetical protein